MTLKIPCGRVHAGDQVTPREAGMVLIRMCADGNLCPHCNAILILKATCLGVADRLEIVPVKAMDRCILDGVVNECIGRLRADVARVDGRT